jgi:hypothetical protein
MAHQDRLTIDRVADCPAQTVPGCKRLCRHELALQHIE